MLMFTAHSHQIVMELAKHVAELTSGKITEVNKPSHGWCLLLLLLLLVVFFMNSSGNVADHYCTSLFLMDTRVDSAVHRSERIDCVFHNVHHLFYHDRTHILYSSFDVKPSLLLKKSNAFGPLTR